MNNTFLRSFVYAFRGIAHTLVVGRNFKVQLGFALVAIALGIAFQIDLTQWAIVVVCIGVVLGGECVNTAIEAVVDLASPEYAELAKHAKDCAAGGVLVCSIASAIVAVLLFLPKILAALGM